MSKRESTRLGPGMLVAAAFIGPGTVVTASRAGAEAGYDLLWAVAFATLGAIVLQLFAARMGIVARQGLGEQLRETIGTTSWFLPVAFLTICALGVGNAAYQTGNLSGAAAGLVGVCGGRLEVWVVVLAIATMVILSIGRYRVLQRVLIGLVVLLSVCFLATALVSLPPIDAVLSGLLAPKLNGQSTTLILALIGTTIVPYNLFLHASSAAENWKDTETSVALRQSTFDTIISIGLGGLVTASVLITGCQAFFTQARELGQLSDIADQLRPVLGSFSGLAFAAGLFSAGLTSAITAPLATAYALCGLLGWTADPRAWHFRGITYAIVVCGAFFAAVYGSSPGHIIVLAQLANGLLLPMVAALILWFASRDSRQRPGRPLLWSGRLVVCLVTSLACWRIFQSLSRFFGESG